MAMIVLRQADTDAYLQFTTGRIDSFTALAAVNASFVRHPVPQSIPPGDRSTLTRFEAALLNIGAEEQWHPDHRETRRAFTHRYEGVHKARSRNGPLLGGEKEDIHCVFQELCTLRGLYTEPNTWTPLDPNESAARLELHTATSGHP
ncbi:MAG: hypothetical protein OXF41_03205 [bacterium]|nr:hypothetical protein [bacterium]